jgi:hypothetical protein
MKVLAPGGAGGGYFGGARSEDASKEAARELREYEASLSAKAKDRVIRGIARALKQAGLPVDPDGDLDTVVRTLAENVPRPGGKGKTFTKSVDAHEKVCKYVAQALNAEFSPGASKPEDMFIDTSLSPAEVCRQVGEWSHSFAQGVNTEFLAVLASARTALKNLKTLDEVMTELYRKITEKASADGDSKLAREVAPLDEVYRRAQTERKKQEELLKNLLHVDLAPDTKALEIAMREESDQYKLVSRLGLVPGTGEFSDTLAAAVSGLGTAASVAQKVHKALAKVGITVRQYLDAKDRAELQQLLDAQFEKGAKGDLAAFLQAAETVRAGFGNTREARFREALEGAGKTGGASEDRPSFGKKLERREAEKQVIVRSFAARLAEHYAEMLAAIQAIGPELGKSIPISDNTEKLNEAVRRLRGHRDTTRRIELALIGIYSDAEAREHKERFVGALRQVVAACADLASETKTPGPLTQLGAACEGVEKTVNTFSDAVHHKFGGASTEATGGDASDLLAGAARNDLSLSEAVGAFTYAYYVAKVRANMAQTAKELDSLGEDYTDLLGGAVAARLDALAAEKKVALELITTNAAAPPFSTAGSGAACLAAAKRLVTDEFAAKARFYNALQAVDLYLKAFASGMAGDPDSARNIKKDLDGAQVIARWFSEQTGDNLWAAFENMGSIDYAAGPAIGPSTGGADALAHFDDKTHYYQKVGSWLADPAHPATFGIPTVGVPCAVAAGQADRAALAQKRIDAVFDDFQALKNLVNAFARIGSRFGGEDLRTKVFMSPAQIYKTLVDYLKCSALSINRSGPGGGAPAALGTPISDVDAAGHVAVNATVPIWGVHFGTVYPTVPGNYEIEDQLFVRLIKAMAAKILVTVGVYDMLERAGPLYDLTPTRMIVGGGETAPEVLEGAAEMYFRLPRLAEYYYQLFRWDGSGTITQKIALMPDIDGVFAGLIRVIFLKAAEPSTGDYTETEVTEIVREVNAIHARFASSGGERATHAAVVALIADINRRYGVIKQQEAKDYWTLVRSARTGEYKTETTTNFSILPGEDETEYASRAPSDRFRVAEAAASSVVSDGLDLDGSKEVKLLRDFRRQIDKEFEGADSSLFGKQTYADLIRQAELELKKTTEKAARMAIATRLIVGFGVGSPGHDKTLMFNETVVTGLNVLGALATLLDQFDRSLAAMDPVRIEGVIMDLIHSEGIADRAIADIAALNGLIAAKGAGFVDAAGLETSIFGRYITGQGGVVIGGRGGIANDVRIQDVFLLMGRLHVAIHAYGRAAGGNLEMPKPSEVSAADPRKHPGGLGTADAALTEQRARIIVAARLAARLLVRYDQIMRDFVESLFILGGDSASMVEVNVDTSLPSGIRLNFSKLRSSVELTLGGVKKYIEALRPHIPKDTLDRFEKSTSQGSVFWIEKHLVDARLRNEEDKTQTLEGLARRASQIFSNLTRDTNIELGARITQGTLNEDPTIAGHVAGDLPGAPGGSRFEDYGRAFAALLYYDAIEQEFGAPASPAQAAIDADSSPSKIFMLNSAWGAITTAGAAAVERYLLYSGRGEMTRFRSAMMVLNELIARFVGAFVTPGDAKIYTGLITPFANGVASLAVRAPFGAHCFPDLAAAGQSFGQRGDPQSDAVLCSSLAAVLRTLTTRPVGAGDTNPTLRHIVTQLIDVPLFMKETMREALPSFAKLFRSLMRKIDLIRHLMDRTSVQLGRPSLQALVGLGAAGTIIRVAAGAAAANAYPTDALGGLKAFGAAMDHNTMKAYLTQIATRIGEMAQSLATISEDVLRELGDRPVYFQTGENSIEQFRIATGKTPFMPHSLLLWYLDVTEHADVNALGVGVRAATDIRLPTPWTDTRCLPSHVYGTADFKVAYGTRGFTGSGSPIALGDFPFTKALLDQYNSTSAPRERFEDGYFGEFVSRALGTLRYLVDTQHYRAMLSSCFPVFGGRTIIGPNTHVPFYSPPAPARAATGTASFALGVSVNAQNIVAVVEETEPELAKKKVLERFASGASIRSPQGRAAERINNLVDMNVIPVNVHALMRGIPLANILNYEFTFEQMAAATFGEKSEVNEMQDVEFRRTRQMFIALTCNPFRRIPLALYGSDTRQLGSTGFVHRMFRGDNDLGMGRPKFLSDQLFNKTLFGSVYTGTLDFDEGGPSTGIGITRGREARTPRQRIRERLGQIVQEMKLISGNYYGPEAVNNIGGLAAATGAVAAVPGGVIRVRTLAWYARTMVPAIRRWRAELQMLNTDRVLGPLNVRWGNVMTALNGGGAGTLPVLEAALAGGGDAAYDALMAHFDPAVGGGLAALIEVLYTAMVDADRTDIEAATPARPAPGMYIDGMTYLAPDGRPPQARVHEVKVHGKKRDLEVIGKYRFDSRCVRKLVFLTNVMRLLRLKFNRELTQSRRVLVESHTAVAPGVTEFGADPFEPNEISGSALPNGTARFSDQDTE